jgi:hypothetical protein
MQRERDATLPKIWTPREHCDRTFEQVEAVMNQHAAVKTFSHVVSPADFKTVDMPLASDKVPPVTPWK